VAAPAIPASGASVAAASAVPRTEAAALKTLTENLLRLSGFGTDESFFKRPLRDFVSQPGGADGDEE
jgi:hypothetical protein